MTSVVYMIHNKLTNFSKAEQKVGRYILDHTNEVIQMSTAELATAAGVSTATVARFGQVIMPDGGYPALKLRLSAEGNGEFGIGYAVKDYVLRVCGEVLIRTVADIIINGVEEYRTFNPRARFLLEGVIGI